MLSALLPLAVAGSPDGAAEGLVGLVTVAVIGAVATAARRSAEVRIPTLVLRRFAVAPAAANGPCIELVGRPKGVVAWLLTVMGLSTETRLAVTDLQFSIQTASLSGEFTNYVPLPHLSSTHCGYSKPIALLVVAVILAVGGVLLGLSGNNAGPVAIVALLAAAGFAAGYFLSKKITVQIVTDGGLVLRLRFRPGLLDGVPIDIAYTTSALALLNSKVLAASA